MTIFRGALTKFVQQNVAKGAVVRTDGWKAYDDLQMLGYGPIEDVLCVQEDRVVGADNCVSWHRRSLQIPPQRHRNHYVRATVRVHEYPDGRLAIFDGPRCLARFDPKGRTDDVASQVA